MKTIEEVAQEIAATRPDTPLNEKLKIEAVACLIKSINDNARSSDGLSRKLVWLNGIIALGAVAIIADVVIKTLSKCP